jgi:hypothetical protein
MSIMHAYCGTLQYMLLSSRVVSAGKLAEINSDDGAVTLQHTDTVLGNRKDTLGFYVMICNRC